MNKNKRHAKQLHRMYARKSIQKLTDPERDNLYMMLFNRKLPKKPK